MLGNIAYREMAITLAVLALLLAVVVGLPVLLLRSAVRARRTQREEVDALHARVAALEAERRR